MILIIIFLLLRKFFCEWTLLLLLFLNIYSGLENRQYGRGDPLRWPRDTLYPQKLALTSPISGGRSVGIVRLWTKATEFACCLSKYLYFTFLNSQ
jgi:hypothetical protein